MKKVRCVLKEVFVFVLCVLMVSVHVSAQTRTKEINHQSQSWVSVNSVIRLNNKFGIVADVHMRRNHFLADPGFYFVRTGLTYFIKDNLSATIGYGQMWVAPKPGWQHYVQEHRIYQQLQTSNKIGKISMLQRIRNEQRWQEKIVNDHFINKYKFTDRVRYLLSFTVPVFSNTHYPSLVVSDELAIQFGKEIVYNTFDQNRVFIGIKQQVSKSLSFDTGYMLVRQQKASGYQYDSNNTFRLFFYYTPDLRHKK